ncbi:MAG: DUF2061 domain-containing protein [Thermodesulfobacteriota bacterium]
MVPTQILYASMETLGAYEPNGKDQRRDARKNRRADIRIIMESKKRSIIKSITWRIVGILTLGIIIWIITGNWGETTLITISYHVVQIVLYYFHERGWLKIDWGVMK